MTTPASPSPNGHRGRRTGAARRGSRFGYAVLAVVVGAVVLAVLVAGFQRTRNSVHSRLVAFEVRPPASVMVTFEVVKPAGRAAVCLVRARAPDGAEVGRAEVPVPARTDGRRTSTVTSDLRTTRTATTGEIYGCRFLDGE